MMQIGINGFAAAISDPATGLTLNPVDRMQHLLEEIELADQVPPLFPREKWRRDDSLTLHPKPRAASIARGEGK